MRRIILFILTLFFPVMTSFGQPEDTQEEKPVRHYMDIYVAGGVSHWNYPLKGGNVTMDASFSAGAGYTFFFHPNVGLQTGLSCSRIASVAKLTDPMEWTKWQDGNPLTDYMGERYVHRTSFNDWREQQQTYLLEIPLGLRFRYFKAPESKTGLHAAFGVKLAIPVYANYKLLAGSVTHTGWYEQWQLVLHDLPGRYETETYTQEESILNRLQTVNAEAYAELGAAFRINPHYEIYVAAYGQFMVNNFSSIPPAEKESIGFRNEKNGYAFMNDYGGIIGTGSTGNTHPWMAGLKVGLSVWPGKTNKEKKKDLAKLLQQFPEMATTPIYVHDTLYITDTICPDERAELAGNKEQIQLDSMLSEAVIWFRLDEYVPILEPAYILDSVAAMMHRYPNLRIHVNGHACRLGTDRYNQRLALLRARAVADLLMQKGVSPDRMYVWSYGAKKPYRYNSPKHLSKDRRVEIIPDTRFR